MQATKPRLQKRPQKKNPTVEKPVTYILDLKVPIDDNLIEINDFENHIKQSLKINGKKGLGEVVEVSTRDSTKLVVQTRVAFSKRYVKYLAKKYLKKHDIRDYMRVISTGKNSYAVKYFNIGDSGEGADK